MSQSFNLLFINHIHFLRRWQFHRKSVRPFTSSLFSRRRQRSKEATCFFRCFLNKLCFIFIHLKQIIQSLVIIFIRSIFELLDRESRFRLNHFFVTLKNSAYICRNCIHLILILELYRYLLPCQSEMSFKYLLCYCYFWQDIFNQTLLISKVQQTLQFFYISINECMFESVFNAIHSDLVLMLERRGSYKIPIIHLKSLRPFIISHLIHEVRFLGSNCISLASI